MKNNIAKIKIGQRLVGTNEPCFIVAEAGVNHNGDLNTAKKMIDAYELLYEEVIERHKARTEKDRIIPQILPQNKLQLTVSEIKSEIL